MFLGSVCTLINVVICEVCVNMLFIKFGLVSLTSCVLLLPGVTNAPASIFWLECEFSFVSIAIVLMLCFYFILAAILVINTARHLCLCMIVRRGGEMGREARVKSKWRAGSTKLTH